MWPFKSKQITPMEIVQYWNTSNIPDEIGTLMNSWKILNPNCQHVVFNEKQAHDFILNEFGAKEANLFLSAAFPAMQSDIFRVAYILVKGGLYIDAATKCLSNLDKLIGENKQCTFMRKWHGKIWNGFILSVPEDPIINQIWDRIITNLTERNLEGIWEVYGRYMGGYWAG